MEAGMYPRTTNVRCSAHDCLTRVPRTSFVFCGRHWRMLTPELQASVGGAHRFNAGYGPSPETLRAISAAVDYLRKAS